jgi:hypothetical protein
LILEPPTSIKTEENLGIRGKWRNLAPDSSGRRSKIVGDFA